MKALAAALALAMASRAVAGDLVFDAPSAAPASYAPLVWRFAEKLTPGFWFTAEQTVKMDLRMRSAEAQVEYLTDRAARECWEQTRAETARALSGSRPLWLGLGIGVALGALGALAAKGALR